ncbi:hypothetical protein D3C75_1251110 [compost metagenome]
MTTNAVPMSTWVYLTLLIQYIPSRMTRKIMALPKSGWTSTSINGKNAISPMGSTSRMNSRRSPFLRAA